MIDVLNLALPYFGLIFLGFACGRYKSIPDRGLAWMDFFIVYLSLPALFFRILAKTPFEQLNNARFILATTLGTFLVLLLSFGLAYVARRKLAEASIAALAGAYATSGTWGRAWRLPPSARRRRPRWRLFSASKHCCSSRCCR